MRLRFRLLPADDRFFALFNQSAMNTFECARRLSDMVNDFDDLEANGSKITVRTVVWGQDTA